jgi:surfeit locus 1 family protein
MIRRIPIVPTLVVLAAVATMIGLGVWQLQRRAWKEALIARRGARG